jgi:hypothetical protein
MKLLGRALVRRARTATGENVLVICGTFTFNDGTPIESVSTGDEQWIMEIETVGHVLRYEQAGRRAFSPEDFLEQEDLQQVMSPSIWRLKD